MRTIISTQGRRPGAEPIVTHVLEEGETWEDVGADQPNGIWTHDYSARKWCKLCERQG